MVFDPVRVNETRSWLSKAKSDLAVAEIIFKMKPSFYAQALFHCQQSIEKSLKAFLTWYDIKFRKTHDLARIGNQCSKLDSGLEKILLQCAPLSKYAWKLRYPGEDEEPTRKEAQVGLTTARKLRREILKRLPKEVHC